MIKKKIKQYLQPAEVNFLEQVALAAISDDHTKRHFLVDEDGTSRYVVFENSPEKPVTSIHYADGRKINTLCSSDSILLRKTMQYAGTSVFALCRAETFLYEYLGRIKRGNKIRNREDTYQELLNDLGNIYRRAILNKHYANEFKENDLHNIVCRIEKFINKKPLSTIDS